MRIKETLKNLIRQHNSAQEIALGVSLGVFIAILPVYGLHTIMVIIAGILVRRSNKIAILVGTNISIPPTFPFITWTGYDIGRLVLQNNYPPLSWIYFKQFSFQRIFEFYWPLFLGSVVLGIILAVIFYFVTFFLIKMWRRKRRIPCS